MKGKTVLVRIIDFVPQWGGDLPTHLGGWPCIINRKLMKFKEIVASDEGIITVCAIDITTNAEMITSMSTFIMCVYGEDGLYHNIEESSWIACYDTLACSKIEVIENKVIKTITLPTTKQNREYIIANTTTKNFRVNENGKVELV